MEPIPFGRPLDCLVTDADALPIHSVRSVAALTLDPAQMAFVQAAGFTGMAGQLLLLPGGSGVAGAVLGLGEDRSLHAHGGLPMALPPGAWRLLPGDFEMDGAVLGFCLGAYQYAFLSKPNRIPARLVADGAAQARSIAWATWLARDLVNTPANLLGPTDLADVTLSLAARFGGTAVRIEGERLEAEYPAVAAVGQGSARSPVVAILRWQGSGASEASPLISLCGKGVCFDSGGYDLKPSAGMLRMKKDMGGAALMLALAAVIMEQDLPVRLAVRIGCVENMVSGAALRPLDVIRTRRGLTVEIGNTDAEGRLVLCDLLADAADEHPAILLDAATLTGAARVALGPDLPALFAPHTPEGDRVADAVLRAGVAHADALWRLPLWEAYTPWFSSGIADINNVASKPMAGAIVAALFLSRFVPAGVGWIHIDTYSWNDTARPGRPEGGEALGLRALFYGLTELIRIHEP